MICALDVKLMRELTLNFLSNALMDAPSTAREIQLELVQILWFKMHLLPPLTK